MDTATRDQIRDKAVYISHSANNFRKVMDSLILHLTKGKQ